MVSKTATELIAYEVRDLKHVQEVRRIRLELEDVEVRKSENYIAYESKDALVVRDASTLEVHW